ncbi:MAG: histidine phosphatase family protein [Proteobacteria bacterium]|nr:histidine phosphatase family protein [Pseudomonadota bacterium]
MTRFWWVRHGPTHKKTMIGWTDAPADLSDTDQIRRLDDHLPKDAVVISSDLARCTTTAKAIIGTREHLTPRSGLREMHFGDWEGRTFDDISTSAPDHIRTFWETPGDIKAPNGESWNQVALRVTTEVNDLCREYKGRDIVIVAHYGVILTQIQLAGGMNAKAATSFHIDNLSVTRLEHLGDAWRIMGVNHKP